MKNIYLIIPDYEILLKLEPEELAGVLMEVFNSFVPGNGNPLEQKLNLHNFMGHYTVERYPPQHHDNIKKALTEAWVWIEREGLIAPYPQEAGFYFVTRRGRSLKTAYDVEVYRRGNLLPKQLLHPQIGQKVWATFLRGDYDTAVFQAFKEVEVSVRTACGFDATVLGVPLMYRAFNETNGPLTDLNVVEAERKALAALFAGAIGSYKNPTSHRHVAITAEEATEMIMLASHLLKIVDARTPNP